MSNIYQIAHIGLQQVQDRVQTLATNAAHATVPGYRRQVATGSGVSFEQLMSAPTAAISTTPSTQARHIDLTTATATATGRSLDAAIVGKEGFFVLSDGNQNYLTRNGSFRVDAGGWLVGLDGLRVKGDSGDIFVGGETVSLTDDGRVMAGEKQVARLDIQRPVNIATARSNERGMLLADTLESVTANLRVAHLEGSNTDSTREMIGMVESMRQYESMVRLVQNYDDMLGRTIQKLGDI